MERHLRRTSSGSWTAPVLRWALGLACIVCAPHSLAESRRDLLGCLARQACVAAQQALPAGALHSHHSCTHTISAGAAKGVNWYNTHTLTHTHRGISHFRWPSALISSSFNFLNLNALTYDASLWVNKKYLSSVTWVGVFNAVPGLSVLHEYSSDHSQAWHSVLSWH